MKALQVAIWLAVVVACCQAFLGFGGAYRVASFAEIVGASLMLYVPALLAAAGTYWVNPKTRATPVLTPTVGGALVAIAIAALNYLGATLVQ